MYQYFGGPILGWSETFVPIMTINEAQGKRRHSYSLCSFNAPRNVDKQFSTREKAMSEMYRICSKYGMSITKVYDDKHDKTYFTNTGAEFHINRMF